MDVIGGKIVDLQQKQIYNGELHLENGIIIKIVKSEINYDHYILPGFIDAHIHIESSMLVPYEFARIAMRHGTVATVSDPHEIANVCGMEGIEYMLTNAKNSGLQFFFGAPSCVPATQFETSGAIIDHRDIEKLMVRNDIWYLSEMMNYPGVLYNDEEVLKKIEIARNYKKPVDGHAPGLKGDDAVEYIKKGCSTDHECVSLDEALWKLKHGMKILIREGSAAKNYHALESLISTHPNEVMFCSDDKHPDDLLLGHINDLVKISVLKHDLFDVLQIACVNPVLHYNLPVGLLQEGDSADFIMVKDLKNFEVKANYVKGINYINDSGTIHKTKTHSLINQFNIGFIEENEIPEIAPDPSTIIIKAIDGSLITEKTKADDCSSEEILKICVVNRYRKEKIHVGFITGFGPLKGAMASSVAHDSHNIVAIGRNTKDLTKAINSIIETKGGLCVVHGLETECLPLPVAGLMHILPAEQVGKAYEKLQKLAIYNGSTLTSPFMTLSFMALLVIPKIKMSDKGLFDAEKFTFM
ncbi:MAG: adenine deaminase [Saprospiraceae bacterium]|nr:adenine deaminase [Saprospiraceae bacterium]MBK8370083.1 adenine deaminase [Saprospiraceae bacterium]